MAFEIEGCCAAQTQTGPTGPQGPQGPVGPPGPPTIVFCFGSGQQQILVDEQISFPVPNTLVGYMMTRWYLRLNIVGSIEFEFTSAPDIESAASPLSGTGIGMEDKLGETDLIGFDERILFAGQVLICAIESVSVDVMQATLCIELELP